MQREPPTWQRHRWQRAVGSRRPNGCHKKGAKKYKRITGTGGFPSAKEHQAPNQTDPVPGAVRAAGAAAAPQEESVVLRPHGQADGRLQPGIPAASQSAGDKGPLRHSWFSMPHTRLEESGDPKDTRPGHRCRVGASHPHIYRSQPSPCSLDGPSMPDASWR